MNEEIIAARKAAVQIAAGGYDAEIIAAALNGKFGGLYFTLKRLTASGPVYQVMRRNDNDYAPDILIWG